ncbi:MAG: ABC transporter ATP-binding protein [Clostridia bacterium]|nr:ABC transporter ATP-binding protein [Clostridia bacterium]MDD4685966.1 ABC transporter ATP-binding protein [Clostridia bacterium]
MNIVKFVWVYLKNYKSKFILGLLLSALSIFFMLILPQITQLFIDSIIDFSNTDLDRLSPFWTVITKIFGDILFSNLVTTLCILFLIIVLLKNIFEYFSLQCLFRASSNSCGRLRADCFRKLSKTCCFPQKSEIYVNFTNDISDLFDLIYKSYPQFFTSIIKIILALTLLFLVDIGSALCITLFIILIIVVGLKTLNKAVKNFNDIRNRRSRMQQVAEEAVSEIREIKIFNREEYALKKFGLASKNHSDSNIKGFGFINKTMLVLDILKVTGFALAILLLALSCFKYDISIGFFVLGFSYSLIAVTAAKTFVDSIQDIWLRLVRISRAMKFINEGNSPKLNNLSYGEKLDIKINNVKVDLNESRIFENFSLKLPYGKSYGIVIGQGEGKSAFAKMLLKFYNVLEGNIYIARQNINEIDVCSLRNQFSYISQEPYIFEDTLLNNIILFDEYNKERLEETILLCGLKTLISKLPNGLESNLTERGVGLSSQEKQKINFARAIYKQAPILIIDSSFNKFSKAFSQKTIKNFLDLYKYKTVIILSERIEDVEFCDEIIYIKNGKVEESGTLKQLKDSKKEFYNYFRESESTNE